jgi:hypothetical protein
MNGSTGVPYLRVFFVQALIVKLLFGPFDTFEHVWLVVVVAICANAQIYFLCICVAFECFSDTKYWVGRCHWYLGPKRSFFFLFLVFKENINIQR